jgi:hypothetical protein
MLETADSPHDRIAASQRARGALLCEVAYPRIEFSRRSRNWWSWLKGTPPECVHLDRGAVWMATLLPDTLYLRGKRSLTRASPRPEVSLCRECLIDTVGGEFAAYSGNVVAFEPDPETFTQYFFVGAPDFERAGLKPELSRAIGRRLAQEDLLCAACARLATWLWFSREQVKTLDDVEPVREAAGERFCAEHGSERLCGAFERIPEANLFYMNLPYGESGAYVWI